MTPPPDHAAIIVAHGSPSAPESQEVVLRDLAAAVAARLSEGWTVSGVTLAAPGAIGRALAGPASARRLLVYPHFMADGWFSTEELPRRLRAAGAADFEILPAFGLEPAVLELCLARARAATADFAPGAVGLLLAAHGSPSDPRPAAAAQSAVSFLRASGTFREVRAGFVDEAPFLASAARMEAPAICLPFFATRAGHVEEDLPAALVEAAFPGPILPPIGTDPEVPGIIAAALDARLRAF